MQTPPNFFNQPASPFNQNSNNPFKPKTNSPYKNFIKWFLGLNIFLLGVLVMITDHKIPTGFFLIAASFLLIPITIKEIEKHLRYQLQRPIKYGLSIALIIAGGIVGTGNNPSRDLHDKEMGDANAHNYINPTPVENVNPQTQDPTPQLSKDDQDMKAQDAVAILDVYVKHNMNDPDSFEEVSYEYSYHDTYFIIELKFRGNNSFGAKVINYIKAKTDLEGNVIKVLETDD